MKPALAIFLFLALFPGTALRAEEAPNPAPNPTTTPATSDQSLLNLCPKDMPPTCACVAEGDGVRVMPANEAYKSRKKVLQVGPKTKN